MVALPGIGTCRSPIATMAPGRAATAAILASAGVSNCAEVQVRPSDECHAGPPATPPTMTKPPWPSPEKPCGKNPGPYFSKVPGCETRSQLAPSADDQTSVEELPPSPLMLPTM